jgi:hypothetical protein
MRNQWRAMAVSMINNQKEISTALDDSSGHSYLQQLKRET